METYVVISYMLRKPIWFIYYYIFRNEYMKNILFSNDNTVVSYMGSNFVMPFNYDVELN